MTVAVYVPAGVPDALDPTGELPPQAPMPKSSIAIIGIASVGLHRELPANNRPEASKRIIQATGIIPGGRLTRDIDPPVPAAAVVVTFAAASAVVPTVTSTEAGTVHTGAGVTTGVTAQLRLTVPLNDPAGVIARLKDAACPATMVAELEDPEAGVIAKSGAAVAAPDKATVCGLPTALSVTARLADASPAARLERKRL